MAAGGYIGSHTVKFANLAKPGTVYAFEPQEDIHKILSQDIALNGLGDYVTAYKMALGDRSCTTKMVRNPKKSDDPTRLAIALPIEFKAVSTRPVTPWLLK